MPTIKNANQFVNLLSATLKSKFDKPVIVSQFRSQVFMVEFKQSDLKEEEVKYVISDVLENEFSCQISDCEIITATGVIIFKIQDPYRDYLLGKSEW